MILALSTPGCAHLRATPIVPWSPWDAPLTWHERAVIEDDPAWQQPIPYAVLIDGNDRPWTYRRTGGDRRLVRRASVGVGGHVDCEDDRGALLPTLRAALVRELGEELQEFPRQLTAGAQPIAWISEADSPVGLVHVGLVFAIPWLMDKPPRPRRGEALEPLGFVDPATVTTAAGYERWSVLAVEAMRTCP